jgi:hypothetical protein
MPAYRYLTWTWQWNDDRTAYAGIGLAPQPWRKRWLIRGDCSSELNDKLCLLFEEPPLSGGLTEPLYGTQARAWRAMTQQRLTNQGYRILSDRDRSTIKAGKQKPRPVYVTDGFGKTAWFPSVTRAARALGMDASTVIRHCQNPDHPWRYGDK